MNVKGIFNEYHTTQAKQSNNKSIAVNVVVPLLYSF